MSFVRLVDAWEQSRQEATTLGPGERCASVESEIGGSMKPSPFIEWLLGDNEPEDEDWEPEDEEPGR